MPVWVRRLLLASALVVAAPFALWWMLLHLTGAVGLLIFTAMLYCALLPLRQDLRSARARCTPRLRRRVSMSDEAVDAEFRRITEFQKLIDETALED